MPKRTSARRSPWPVVVALVAVLILAAGGLAAAYLWTLHRHAAPLVIDPPQPPEPDAPAVAAVPPPAWDPNDDPAAGPDDPAETPAGPDAEWDPSDAAAGRERPVLVLDPGGHSGAVRAVLFARDGKRMVSAGDDATIRVWDLATGVAERVIRLPVGPAREGAIYAAALAPDGKRIAVGGMPFGAGKHGVPIYLVSLETGRVERVYDGHSQVITSLAFSADGRWLASGSADRSARVYKVRNGQVVGILPGYRDRVTGVAFHPADARLATSSADGTVRVWTPSHEGLQERVLGRHASKGNCVAWSPDGATVAVGTGGGRVHLCPVNGEPPRTLANFGAEDGELVEITSLAFSPDGSGLLYTGIGRTGRAGIVDVATGDRRVAFAGHTNTVQRGSLSADGTLAVTTGGNDHETFVWRTADGSLVQAIQAQGQSVWGVGWSPDGTTVNWGNTNRGALIPPLTPLERGFRLDALEPVATAADEARRAHVELGPYALTQPDFFRIVIARDGQPHYTFESPLKGERLYSATLLAGDMAVVGGGDGMYLVDLKAKRLAATLAGHAGIVLAVAPSPDDRFFVSGGIDQTLRIWRPGRRVPVLSLFVAGAEWIAWTPEGYYAASAGGERLMGWQVNRGPTAAAAYHAAAQFHQSLYQPDVIAALLPAGGDLARALVVAAEKQGRPAAELDVAKVLPPAVAFTSPTPRAGEFRLDRPAVAVKVTAASTGDQPVQVLRLLVDGRPYGGEAGIKRFDPPRRGRVEGSWQVDLPPGRHTLQAQAESAVSTGLSAPLAVFQSAGQTRPPNLFALVVGVSDYPGPLRLRFAATDAENVAAALRQTTGGVFARTEVRLVTDRAATKAAVVDGLEWLGKSMTAQDVGVCYFSGHGARAGTGFYLVPADARNDDVAGSCVPGDLLRTRLANMPGRMVAILDACHSGAAAFSTGRPDELVRDLSADDCGVVVLCSSRGAEFSIEAAAVRGGLYTHWLVDGLRGKADFNKDGVVYVHEASRYAASQVRRMSNGIQNPTLGRSPHVRPFALTKPE